MIFQNIIAVFRKGSIQEMNPAELLKMEGMAERNEKRIEAIKKEMGEKWILHPVHIKHRLDEPRPV